MKNGVGLMSRGLGWRPALLGNASLGNEHKSFKTQALGVDDWKPLN